MKDLFTEDDFSVEDPFPLLEKLEPNVKEFLLDVIKDELFMYLHEISFCESPIERLLGIAIREKNFINIADDGKYFLETQEEIKIDKNVYRVDFLMDIVCNGINYKIVIECDGHDYHEKTKEQAIRDRRKDRLLQREGFIIFRFTGSEIVKNPYSCVREISDFLYKQKR